MLKIRLMRIGAKGRPFYRIVVVDERKKRTGAYIDQIGTYNPLSNPKEKIINQEKVDAWVKKGAQMSDGFLRIIGKAKQKPERKSKKDDGKGDAPAPVAEVKAEETVEEAPIEEPVVSEEVASEVDSASVEEKEAPVEETVPAVEAEEEKSEEVAPEAEEETKE